MKTKFPYFRLIYLEILFIFFLIASCKKDSEEKTMQDKYLVAFEEIIKVSEKHILEDPSNLKKSKEIKSSQKIDDKNGFAAYYILNYENGFVIISADKRETPVLAYSYDNTFPLNADNYPQGLVGWLFVTKQGIEKIRDSKIEQSIYIKRKWDDYLASNESRNFKNEPLPGECEDTSERVGPIISTIWNQYYTFNDSTDFLNCNYGDGKAPAGCIPVAMGQIMKFYQFPYNYNWGVIPLNFASAYTAGLMKDIGLAVEIVYTCNSSDAYSNKIAPAFINDFGYSSAHQINYDAYAHNIIITELENNRPVIFSGGKRVWDFWPFSSHSADEHAWVCDGFQTNFSCETNTSSLIFHMNWGWNGYSDGWFGFGTFNPTSPDGAAHNFDFLLKVVVEIHP